MAFELRAMKKKKLTVVGLDAAGNETGEVLQEIVWQTSDSGIINLADQIDPSIYAQAPAPLGSAQITVTGKTQEGTILTESVVGNVIAGETVSLRIDIGVEEPL